MKKKTKKYLTYGGITAGIAGLAIYGKIKNDEKKFNEKYGSDINAMSQLAKEKGEQYVQDIISQNIKGL